MIRLKLSTYLNRKDAWNERAHFVENALLDEGQVHITACEQNASGCQTHLRLRRNITIEWNVKTNI